MRERKRVSLVVRGRSVALFRVLRFVVNFWWFVAKVQKKIDQSTCSGVSVNECAEVSIQLIDLIVRLVCIDVERWRTQRTVAFPRYVYRCCVLYTFVSDAEHIIILHIALSYIC